MASFTFSDFVAFGAFGLSIYAAYTTAQFNKRQLALIRSQERLNALLLQQGNSQIDDALRADVDANIVNFGNNHYRLRIFNKGKAEARNVAIDFPDGNPCVLTDDLEEKFPLECMAPHKSVDLIAAVGMSTPRKFPVKLYWEDNNRHDNEKVTYVTL